MIVLAQTRYSVLTQPSSLLEKLAVDIPYLRALRIFIFSFNIPYTSSTGDIQREVKEIAGPMVQEWYKRLAHFQVAYFQVAEKACLVEKSFLAWKRDESEPRMVEGLEAWNISPRNSKTNVGYY